MGATRKLIVRPVAEHSEVPSDSKEKGLRGAVGLGLERLFRILGEPVRVGM